MIDYSLGADIAGELAENINANRGPIKAERLTAAAIISSPARNGTTTTAAEAGTAAGNGSYGIKEAFDFGELGDKVLEFCHSGDIFCDTSNALPGVSELPIDGLFDFAPLGGQFTIGAFRDILFASLASPENFRRVMQDIPQLLPAFKQHLVYPRDGNGMDKGVAFIQEHNV